MESTPVHDALVSRIAWRSDPVPESSVLVTTFGGTTVSEADPLLVLLPPETVVKSPGLTFTAYVLAAAEVTSTYTQQELNPARSIPLVENEPAPAVAVRMFPVPLQEFVTLP